VIEKKEGLIMLEKAKNRKIFYFFLFIILGFSLFISPVFADSLRPDGARYYLYGSTSTGPGYSWDSIHDATSTTSVSTNTQCGAGYYSDNNADQYDGWLRYAFRFDTTYIDSLDEVSDITFKIRSHDSVPYLNTLGVTGEKVCIVKFNPYYIDTINVADWNNFGTYIYDSIAIESLTADGTVIFNLSETIINKGGITFIGILLKRDIDDSKPTWSSEKQTVAYFESFDAVKKPYLNFTVSEANAPEANITSDVTTGELPLTVNFTDFSTGFSESYPYPEYTIYFGDGESYTGERQYTGENWYHEYENEGTYNVTYIVTEEGIAYSDSIIITVTDTSTNYQVQVHGLNTAAISGANVSIWYNGAYQDSEGTSISGISYFDVPPYRFVNGTVTKSGYQTAYFDTYIYPENNLEFVTLYLDNETPGSGDSYGNYIVTFKNAVTGENVAYSNIEVYSDSGYTALFYDEYSNFGGVWTGLIPMNTTYYYKYPETIGYYSQSWSYNLTSSPAYKTVNLIPKSGATSTATPTPTITTIIITPTVTYTYNDSNLSTLNVKERFTNLLVLAGFQNAESADLIFAMIIVLGCTALIGWITLSGSGAGMGAIIGFVFSLGLGLIPLWLLIAAIFFGCLYVALKLFGGSGE
jgi:PKD repeat protein